MIEARMVRVVDENDPNRCVESYKHGQCPYKAEPHATKCKMHGGVREVENYNRKLIFEYRADIWRESIAHFANNDNIKTLRQEIGVARMLLEETLKKCKDTDDLMLYSTKINAMVDQINKLVVNCTKLEDRLGIVIDKSAVLNLGEQILQILKQYVHEDKFQAVANQITQAILKTNDPLALEE